MLALGFTFNIPGENIIPLYGPHGNRVITSNEVVQPFSRD